MIRVIGITVLLVFFCSCADGHNDSDRVIPNTPDTPPAAETEELTNFAAGKFYTIAAKALKGYEDTEALPPYTDGTKLTDEQTGTVADKTAAVGWQEKEIEIIVDLGSMRTVNTFAVHAIRDENFRIFYPRQIRLSCSSDRENWLPVRTPLHFASAEDSDAWTVEKSDDIRCRYIRLVVSSPSSGDDLITLIDEIKIMGKYVADPKYVPAEGCYHGAFNNGTSFANEGITDKCPVATFETRVGKQLAIMLWYQNMKPGRSFSEIQRVREDYWGIDYDGKYRFMIYGWLPLISSAEWASGALDEYMISYFKEVASESVRNLGPIWFRPANEMNGSWTPYYGDPQSYIKAWRRMYNIAEQLGVTEYNVFVWSPNYASMPDKESNAMKKYYPGDIYVDWIGVSLYPPSLSDRFPEEQRYPYTSIQNILQISDDKPVMVTEGGYAISSTATNCDCERWVTEWFGLKDRVPRLKALIWENHVSGTNGDRRIQKHEGALNIYREKVADPYWLDKIPDEVYKEIERRRNSAVIR